MPDWRVMEETKFAHSGGGASASLTAKNTRVVRDTMATKTTPASRLVTGAYADDTIPDEHVRRIGQSTVRV